MQRVDADGQVTSADASEAPEPARLRSALVRERGARIPGVLWCGRGQNLWVFDGFYNGVWGTDAGVVVPVDNPIINIADCSTAADGTVWLSSHSGAVLWRRD